MLTDKQVKNATKQEKPYRLVDSGGLHLYVTTAGGKLWRLRYKFDGKEKLLSIGQYDEVSLAAAREERDRAKAFLKSGRDPAAVKKIEKISVKRDQADTFETVAREWHEMQAPTWTEVHRADVLHSLERDVFPFLGAMPIKDIGPSDILSVLRLVEKRGAIETAKRLRQRASGVFVFAIASGRSNADPAAIIQRALAPLRKGRQPAITKLEPARKLLADFESLPGHPFIKLAHRFLALTAARPGTIAGTPWSELEGVGHNLAIWHIPAVRMKLKLHYKDDEERNHLVPLSWQALEVIEAIKTMTGKGPMVFPNVRHSHKPMSENALGYMMKRAGYEGKHVPHGWRATFSSVMNENFPADKPIIDLMLAHVPKDKVEGAYNRAQHLDRRIVLAQEWADLIMKDRPPAMSLTEGPRKREFFKAG